MKEGFTQWASGLLWASGSWPGSALRPAGGACLEAAEASAKNLGSCDLHKCINLHSMSCSCRAAQRHQVTAVWVARCLATVAFSSLGDSTGTQHSWPPRAALPTTLGLGLAVSLLPGRGGATLLLPAPRPREGSLFPSPTPRDPSMGAPSSALKPASPSSPWQPQGQGLPPLRGEGTEIWRSEVISQMGPRAPKAATTGRACRSRKAVSPSASGHRTDGDSPAAGPGGARRPLHTPLARPQPSPPRRPQALGSEGEVTRSPTRLTLGQEPWATGATLWACQAFPDAGGGELRGAGLPGSWVLPRCLPAPPGLQLSSATWKSQRTAPKPGVAPAHAGKIPGRARSCPSSGRPV